MRAGRKAISLLLVITIAVSTTGCWNYRESEDMVFVVGIAFDRLENGRIHLTVEENNVQGKDIKPKPVYLEVEGDTFYDAMRNAIKLAENSLYWNHMEVVIISQEIATNNFGDLLDMLLRFPQMRLTMVILVSKNATAMEVMKADNPHQGLNSTDILGSLKAEKQLEKAPYIKLYQFASALMGEGHSAVLPACGAVDMNGQKVEEVSGMAAFNGPWLAGFFDENDARTFMLLDYNCDEYDLPLPADPERKFTSASVQLFTKRVDIEPDFIDGKPTVNIYIHGEIVPVEISGASTDPKQFKTVTDALISNTATALENSVLSFFQKTKDMNSADIIGIGSLLQDAQPQLWKQINGDWRNLYRNLEVNVRVDVTVRNTGFAAESLVKGE